MNICIAASANWLKYVAVEMYTLFKNNPAPIKVYIMSDTLKDNDLYEIDKVCQICGEGYTYEYLNVESLYNQFMLNNPNVEPRFSKYTLYRIFIPYLINDDRLLYLDADALVVSNIEEFYNMDFGDNLLIGCTDVGINNDYKLRYGIDKKSNYINAGVALWNLKEIRELKLFDEWVDMVKSHYPNHDQDLLNITCQNRIRVVDFKYNVSLSTGLNILEKTIKIMHYAGIKPEGKWVKDLPFSQLWDKWQVKYDKEIKPVLEQPIPKIIHYCWFGKNEKPPKIEQCLASWKKHLKDYQFVEWNEDNFDINCNEYVKEAYNQKKWAFITDYIRLWALYKYGGIYMDLDVEVLRPLDMFLKNRAFTGHETSELLVTATMGAEKHHPWIKMLLDYYIDAKLIDKPNTNIITEMSIPYVEKREKGYTYLQNGVVIYPIEVFCPFNHLKLQPMPTSKSYCVHHFLGSWTPRGRKVEKKYNVDISELFNNNIMWQMSCSEKAVIKYLFNKMQNKNVAIEVGSYLGGFTQVLSKEFQKVYSLDIDHTNIFGKEFYKNVEWIEGDSKQTLPELINKLNESEEHVDFILVDADHEYQGVYNDLNNILKYKPKSDVILLIHDSFYVPSRQAICNTKWKDNPYVHYIDTDFVIGDLNFINGKYQFIGGICLVIMSDKIREKELLISQNHDVMYCKTNDAFKNRY